MYIEKFNQPSYHGHDCGIRFPKCQCCWFRSNRFNESEKKSYNNFPDTVFSTPTLLANEEKLGNIYKKSETLSTQRTCYAC